MKTRTRHAAILLAAVAVLAAAGFIRFWQTGQDTGFPDDFKDVKLEQIIEFAQRSNSAYHEPRVYRHEYGEHVEDGEFPATGLRVYLESDPAAPVQWIVIRGTANLKDILDDLEFVGQGEHELGINVHKGFDRALKECLPWILQRIDRTRPIRVTGHSLGGSVAALLVATLDHRGYKNVCAITFGEPKFTDAYGAAKLAHLSILRVVHDEDPIPLLPPLDVEGVALALYHHSGPEVIVRASGHFLFLPEHASRRMDVSRYWAELENIRPMCHDMVKGYLPALKSALSQNPQMPVSRNGP